MALDVNSLLKVSMALVQSSPLKVSMMHCKFSTCKLLSESKCDVSHKLLSESKCGVSCKLLLCPDSTRQPHRAPVRQVGVCAERGEAAEGADRGVGGSPRGQPPAEARLAGEGNAGEAGGRRGESQTGRSVSLSSGSFMEAVADVRVR